MQSARSSITESIHSSDGYPSDDNYDEAELKPRYGLKMNDPQLGGYIHFPKRSASASAVQTTQSLGNPVNGELKKNHYLEVPPVSTLQHQGVDLCSPAGPLPRDSNCRSR